MIPPTIHLGGTSRDELLRQLTTASDAVRIAIEKLGEAAPHARDYDLQPQNGTTVGFKIANYDHHERVKQLVGIKRDLDEIAEAIA